MLSCALGSSNKYMSFVSWWKSEKMDAEQRLLANCSMQQDQLMYRLPLLGMPYIVALHLKYSMYSSLLYYCWKCMLHQCLINETVLNVFEVATAQMSYYKHVYCAKQDTDVKQHAWRLGGLGFEHLHRWICGEFKYWPAHHWLISRWELQGFQSLLR